MLFAALIVSGSQAFADDAKKSDSMTSEQKQMMKDCMAKQKAKDSSMSKDDMKKACMSNMKMQSGHMDSTAPK
jgi:pentapeptide MXKDX repeat protein